MMNYIFREPIYDMFSPAFYDPFGCPVFTPKRKKLKGWQKKHRK